MNHSAKAPYKYSSAGCQHLHAETASWLVRGGTDGRSGLTGLNGERATTGGWDSAVSACHRARPARRLWFVIIRDVSSLSSILINVSCIFQCDSSFMQCRSSHHHPINLCADTRVIPNACQTGCSRHRNHKASRAQDGHRLSCFSRTGRSETHQIPPEGTRRRGWAVRWNDLPPGFLSSTESDVAFDEDKYLSFEEFEKALLLNAPGEDGGGGSTAATGINWRLLIEDVLTQPLFFGVFALLATPAIRESRIFLIQCGVSCFFVINREACDPTHSHHCCGWCVVAVMTKSFSVAKLRAYHMIVRARSRVWSIPTPVR